MLTGCGFFGGDTAEPETGATTGSGAGGTVEIDPPAARRFDGVPTHIGFEPLPLEGGDFPILTDFVFLPGGEEFLALNRTGKVGRFRLEEQRAVLLDSFQIPAVFTEGDCAASSIALDSNFSINKIFYVGYCIDTQYNVIKRYVMSETDFASSLFTATNILAAGDPKADIPQHAIGTIQFGPDGAMWANIGERRRDGNAQDLTNELGKVIRFVPLKQPQASGFELVQGNAFPDDPARSGLIYAYGLRNPWRGIFDTAGRYWVADVGSTSYEEINMITKRGQNFGWPIAEGPICRSGSCASFVRPVRTWDTSPTHPFILEDPLAKAGSQFRTAWVGIAYRPPAKDPYKGLLTNAVLYGDFYIGFVRAISVDAKGEVVSDRHVGHLELPTAWRQGKDGYIYAATMFRAFNRDREGEGDGNLLPQTQQGQLWRVVPLP